MIRYILILNLLLGFIANAHSSEGSVSREVFFSSSLGVKKHFSVYLPKDYSTSKIRYPVIYLLHGLGATETSWVEMGIESIANGLHLQAIIVMPDGDRGFYSNSITKPDYTSCMKETNPQPNQKEKREDFCVHKGDYEDYIVKDLIKKIDLAYRTIPKREARALSGESAGGFGAVMLALRHPDLFGSTASHSGLLSLLYDGPKPFVAGKVGFRKEVNKQPQSPIGKQMLAVFGDQIEAWKKHDPSSLALSLKDGKIAIYVDCGTEDDYGFQNQALHFHEILENAGIHNQFELVPGKHDEALWKDRISHSLRFHVAQFEKSRNNNYR